MKIPEAVLYTDILPETECLALFPGAVIGQAYDPARELLKSIPGEWSPGMRVCAYHLQDVPAAHILAAAVMPLQPGDAACAALLKDRLREAIALADGLGVTELSLLSLPVDGYDSRLFSFNAVIFRVLMEDREQHPCLERIRFFCRSRTDAEWLARVYNFYYPADKSERMTVPDGK